MIKIKNYWLRSFLQGYLIGLIAFGFLSLVLVFQTLELFFSELPAPTQQPTNELIRTLDGKQIINIKTQNNLELHPDTLYFLYFSSHFPYIEDELKTVTKLSKLQREQKKPFQIYLISSSKNKKGLKSFEKWVNLRKISPSNCYYTKDLEFVNYKLIYYKDKIRFQTNQRTDWTFKHIPDFLNELYQKESKRK